MTDGFGKWKTMTSDYDYDQLGNRFKCGSGFLRIIEWFHHNGVRLRALAAVQMAGVFLKRLVKRAKWKVECVFKQGFGRRLLHGG